MVVTSSAVSPDNPEVVEAHARKIPVIQRAEMLAELMRLKYGIAIAGMHGKTTTTSMVASLCSPPAVSIPRSLSAAASMRSAPTLASAPRNTWWPRPTRATARFLKLSPILAVVTNLDREHMDCYADMEDVERAFLAFMDRVPFYGAVTACIDNPQLAAILPRAQRRVFTYGTAREADYRLEPLPGDAVCHSRFQVVTVAGTLGPFELHVPGRHNVLNATAAVAIAHQLEVPADRIAAGHHATSAASTAASSFAARRAALPWWTTTAIIPLRSRPPWPPRASAATSTFTSCSSRTATPAPPTSWTASPPHSPMPTQCFVLPIYAASEQPIPGVTAERLAERIEGPRVSSSPTSPQQSQSATAAASEGDLILTLGAGNVSQLAPAIVDALKSREE